MNDYAVRSRYPRHKIPDRRKRRGALQQSTLSMLFMRQIFICAIIVLAVSAIKYANTPFTSFLYDKVRSGLSQNIDINSIYKKLDSIVTDIKNLRNPQKEADNFGEEAVPTNTSAYSLGDMYDAGATATSPQTDGNHTADTSASQQNLDTQGNQKTQSDETSQKNGTANQSTTGTAANSTTAKLDFIVPAAGKLGSPFGQRVNPITKAVEFHKGIDIEANMGDAVKAAYGGEVIETGTETTLGNYVKIKHTYGFTTMYAHCSSVSAKKGQTVKQGDTIAKVGSTGLSTGPHLHFEIAKDGSLVNPLNYIKVPTK